MQMKTLSLLWQSQIGLGARALGGRDGVRETNLLFCTWVERSFSFSPEPYMSAVSMKEHPL